jgi:hypothetical protein
MSLAFRVYDGIRVCVCRVRDSHPEKHVSLGAFGEQLLHTSHKIMSIATLDV